MDFIKKLLLFSGFDTILVIVDQLIKQVIFISAYDTIMSVDLAHLFVLHMFSKYDVPSHVISDRGLEFVLNFFCSLSTALDIWLYFTLGYHPESNGQTECTNWTLEQYLHVYCNYQQNNWFELLSLVEIHWYAIFSCFWFQSRWQSLCQSSVLLDHSVFKETLWKISWTL